MDFSLLIDGIFRQTIVLIAQLVQATGHRPQLVRLTDQIFRELDAELRRQDLRPAMIANLFGMKLRTYYNRVRRARRSEAADRPLFNRLVDFIVAEAPVEPWRVDREFADAETQILRAALAEVQAAGLVELRQNGRRGALFHLREDALQWPESGAFEAEILWVVLDDIGPATIAELATHFGLDPALDATLTRIRSAVDTLLGAGRAIATDAEPPRFRAVEEIATFDDTVAWGAGLFDHYQALVGALCRALDQGQRSPEDSDERAWPPAARRRDRIGGSTYTFTIPAGHALEDEVLGSLSRFRAEMSDLRVRVDRETEAMGLDPTGPGVRSVVFYFGQNILDGGE